jgi:hypothetical protein
MFSTIVRVLDVPRRKVQVFWDAKNNGTLSLDPAYFEHLHV